MGEFVAGCGPFRVSGEGHATLCQLWPHIQLANGKESCLAIAMLNWKGKGVSGDIQFKEKRALPGVYPSKPNYISHADK